MTREYTDFTDRYGFKRIDPSTFVSVRQIRVQFL